MFLLIGFSSRSDAKLLNFNVSEERVHDLEEGLSFSGQIIHQASRPGSRYPQIEDRMIAETLDSSITYYGVYDGHGGPNISEFLAKQFHHYLDKNRGIWIDNPERLADLFESFNHFILSKIRDEFISKAQNNGNARKMGTVGSTASLMIHIPWQDNLIFATLGDSPAMVISQKGHVHRSIDHDPLREEEKCSVESKGGIVQKTNHQGAVIGNKVYPSLEIGRVLYPAFGGQGRLAMSRAFGDYLASPFLSSKPDIYLFPKKQVAFVILASDGLGEAFYYSRWTDSPSCVNWLANDINLLIAEGDNDNLAKRYLYSIKTHANLGTDDISLMIIQ